MAADGDVTVYYRLIPTEDSIKKSAEKIVSNINSGFKKGFSTVASDASAKLKGAFGFVPGLKGMGQVVSGAMGGGKGVGAAGAGGAASGSVGIAAIAGGIMAMVGMMAILTAATLIVSAFFDAVGPLIKVLVKILTAVILILLMPFLKALLPYLPGIVKGLIALATFVADLEQGLIDAVGGALAAFFTGVTNFGEWLFENIGNFLQGVFDFGVWLGGAIGSFIVGVFDFAVWLGGAIWSFIIGIFNFGIWLGTKIIDFIKGSFDFAVWLGINLIKFISEALFDFGIWLTTNISNFIGGFFNIGEWIKQQFSGQSGTITGGRTFNEAIPFIGGQNVPPILTELGNIAEGGIKGLAGLFGLDDFISRPGQGIQSFSPDDTIIGMKKSGGLGGGVTVNNTFNIEAGVDSSRLKEILSQFAREQARELRMRSSYFAGAYS